MECFWRLYSYWPKAGNCYQQDPAIFHVRLNIDNGLPYYHLYDTGFLEKYAEIYLGGEAESLVLFVASFRLPPIGEAICTQPR